MGIKRQKEVFLKINNIFLGCTHKIFVPIIVQVIKRS